MCPENSLLFLFKISVPPLRRRQSCLSEEYMGEIIGVVEAYRTGYHGDRIIRIFQILFGSLYPKGAEAA